MNNPFIVAEISGNHNGSLDTAIELIKTAKDCGADAVKIQTFTPDSLTIKTENEDFKIKNGPWKSMFLYDIYEITQTPRAWHSTLFEVARALGITLFSSPFSIDDVDFLENFNPPIYKIASNEALDAGLVERVRQTGKPVFISLGCCTKEHAIKLRGDNVTLLYCVSEYPPEKMNLATLDDLQKPFGLSDHSPGYMAAVVAVSKGASVIEKHLALDRYGLDSHYALLPHEFKEMVDKCREAHKLLGDVEYPGGKLPENVFLRRWYAKTDIKKGETFTPDNARTVRGIDGLFASLDIQGKVALEDTGKDCPIIVAAA